MPVVRHVMLILLMAGFACRVSALELSGIAQLRVTRAESPASWLYGGSGLYRYDAEHEGVDLGQTLLSARQDLSSSLSAHAVLHLNPDPEFSPGFSQAFVRYNPLSASRYEWRIDAGAFYPALSLENPDIGWTSPYLYSNSAINSWVGEELRTIGLQASLSRPGRRFNSPHSLAWVGAVFKANDPAGSLLAWRGFTIHDRQSVLDDSIPFADNPVFDNPPLHRQANVVLPFEEVDGRFGYYLGMHWDYYKRSQVRVYYYDNNGDPGGFNRRTGQYAWDTRFLSVAWLFKFTRRTRLVAQWLDGNTAMGPSRGIDNDFGSYFVLLSHRQGQHRISLRYDDFSVVERDDWAFDPNDSRGENIAVAWRYDLGDHWQLGGELSYIDSFVENRALWGEPQYRAQRMLQANLQFRFQ